jgi:hypothetical protein
MDGGRRADCSLESSGKQFKEAFLNQIICAARLAVNLAPFHPDCDSFRVRRAMGASHGGETGCESPPSDHVLSNFPTMARAIPAEPLGAQPDEKRRPRFRTPFDANWN